MFTAASERTVEMLRASLPTVEAHRLAIIGSMAASLGAADPSQDGWRVTRIAASLVDTLIEEVRHLTSGGRPTDVEAVRLEHARHGIGRFHYSRFGDALAAVMVDVARAALPRPVGGAWGHAFWGLISRLEETRDPEPALAVSEPKSANHAEAEGLLGVV